MCPRVVYQFIWPDVVPAVPAEHVCIRPRSHSLYPMRSRLQYEWVNSTEHVRCGTPFAHTPAHTSIREWHDARPDDDPDSRANTAFRAC